MSLIKSHVQTTVGTLEGRAYDVYLCESGGNYCNGLIVKHDVFDQKNTYITPCHTTTTLHINYVTSVTTDDLLKSIFTTHEWCAFVKLT